MVGKPLPTSLHVGVDTAVIALWLGHFSGVPELSHVASF
jgi:hypothetical protein